MNWIKLLIFVVAYIILLGLLVLIVPPYTEDKTYSCHVNEKGECLYPQIINWNFIILSIILTLMFIIASLIITKSDETNAYIMSVPEAISKITKSNRLFYNIPPKHMMIPTGIERNVDGGKKKMIWYINPFDSYKTNILFLNLMSDYATTNVEPKMFDPLINNIRAPMSIVTARQLLISKEKDLASRLARLENELQSRNLYSGPVSDIVKDSVDVEKSRLKKEGVI